MKKLFLIYSNFSNHCKSTLNLSKQLENDINTLCIDNKKIRTQVTSNKKFNITVVPTILLEIDNNDYEKYEGKVATDFLMNIVNNKKQNNYYLEYI